MLKNKDGNFLKQLAYFKFVIKYFLKIFYGKQYFLQIKNVIFAF